MSYLRLPSFRTNILLAIILRLALIAYSEYYDARPDSNVKYTDVDYRVFTDAAWFVVRPSAERGNIARGLVGKWLGIGEYVLPNLR
jgi:phosphatidylinositol glycan class M